MKLVRLKLLAIIDNSVRHPRPWDQEKELPQSCFQPCCAALRRAAPCFSCVFFFKVRALVEVQSDAWLRPTHAVTKGPQLAFASRAADQKLGKLPCRRIRQDETVEEAMEVRGGTLIAGSKPYTYHMAGFNFTVSQTCRHVTYTEFDRSLHIGMN